MHLLPVSDALFKKEIIVRMCLCVGISTGAHRDKKRALDDPEPGGCDLADVCAGKVASALTTEPSLQYSHMKLTTKSETL